MSLKGPRFARNGLPCARSTAAVKIRKHAVGILAYLDTKMTNGLVEGINNKLRVIARRAYGFHSHGALISMLFLCCGGIELAPPLPTRV